MDAVTILGLSYVGKEGVAVVSEFVREIFGPSAKALGEGIAAPLREWASRRNQRAEQLVMQAADALKAAGITPTAVPGEVLIPLLQAGASTEQPELQEKWVALLANAAADIRNGIIPGFIDILRQLTPTQARILDWMYAQKHEVVGVNCWPDFERPQIETHFDLDPGDYALLITDMERLKLIEPHKEIDANEEMINGDQVLEWVLIQLNDRERYKTIALTSLGVHFMKACTRPQPIPST